MDVTLVWHLAVGLVTPSPEGYSEAEVAELRRVRRLHEDLELDHAAIEIVLHMARRIRELSAEIGDWSRRNRGPQRARLSDAEWEESS